MSNETNYKPCSPCVKRPAVASAMHVSISPRYRTFRLLGLYARESDINLSQSSVSNEAELNHSDQCREGLQVKQIMYIL